MSLAGKEIRQSPARESARDYGEDVWVRCSGVTRPRPKPAWEFSDRDGRGRFRTRIGSARSQPWTGGFQALAPDGSGVCLPVIISGRMA